MKIIKATVPPFFKGVRDCYYRAMFLFFRLSAYSSGIMAKVLDGTKAD